MKRILFILAAVINIIPVTHAQLSAGGEPLGFKFFRNWKQAPVAEMPLLDTTRLKIESLAKAQSSPNKIVHFGYSHTTNITPANSGNWVKFDNGSRVWMMRIHSAGAHSISLGFKNMQLSNGARLFIYNKDHSILLGAFINKQPYVDGILATEQVTGDELMIEYEEPDDNGNNAPFVIERVSHDFLGVNDLLKSFGFGQAGNCQVNINCPAGVPYGLVKKSVAAVIEAGVDLCSGSLINSTKSDGTPYFLTAHHCWQIHQNPASWVFRFNWEAPGCANPSSSPSTTQSISGATLVSTIVNSDFCLVKMSSAPPASYGVVYAGWDRRNIAPLSVTCISHPNVDIKKIAISTLPARDSQNLNWRIDRWTLACPEHGSSGSPALNQNQKIVGQLRGGPSSCSASQNDLWDLFGKFSRSWEGGGTSATRLKDWLDPTGSNVDTMELYDPNRQYDAALTQIITPVAMLCNTVQQPKVVIKNTGVYTFSSLTISVSLDNGLPVSSSWSGSLAPNATATVFLSPTTFTPGNHILKISVSKPNNGNDNDASNNSQTTSFTIVNAAPLTLPVTQGFEDSTFPNNNSGWSVVEPNVGTYTWKRVTSAAASGNASLRKDNYNQNDFGQADHLYSPFLNFAAIANYKLSFKVAYSRFSTLNPDSLVIYVSNDCANTWQRVYAKTGSALATAPDTTVPFFPQPTQWRTDSIDLSGFSSSPSFQIRFTNVSGYGNHLFIDDIKIDQRNALPVANFITSDTFCTGRQLSLNNTTVGGINYSWNMVGANPPISSQPSPIVTFPNPGNYTVALTASNIYGTQSKTKLITVVDPPAPTIAQFFDTLSTGSFYSYQWYKDGVAITGATNQEYNFSENGRYMVKVMTSYNCDGQSQEFNITNVDVDELSLENIVTVAPNPARTFVTIQDKKPGSIAVEIQLYNMLGQQVISEQMNRQSSKTIDLTKLAIGIYTLRISKGDQSLTKKLVIQ